MFPSVSDEPSAGWTPASSAEKIKSITLSQAGKADAAWKLTRDDEEAEFKLVGAAASEVLDTTATDPLKSLFSYARFDDVVPAAKVAERAADWQAHRHHRDRRRLHLHAEHHPAKPGTRRRHQPGLRASATDNYLVTVAVTAELPKSAKKPKVKNPRMPRPRIRPSPSA